MEKNDPCNTKSARDATVGAVESALPGGKGLPLLGQVSAGTGMLAEENIEDYVEVPSVIGGQEGDYVLEVRGESMKNAGIMDGDYVIVHPTPDARNGEIVVAMLDEEEATVKRLFKETDHLRLQPENEEFDPIISTDAQVIGKVIGCFRAM